MRHYVIKAALGNCAVDVFCVSEKSAQALLADILEAGGVSGPGGWVSASAIVAVLDCAVCGITPPAASDNVVKLAVVGGRDVDAGGSGEGEVEGLPEEPGA